MKVFTVSPTGVDATGTIESISVDAGFQRFRLDSIQVRHKSGSATSIEVIVSTDTVSATPGVVDAEHEIASYVLTTDENLVFDDNGGAGFAHRLEETAGELRIHIVPNIGSDNDYEIVILQGRRF